MMNEIEAIGQLLDNLYDLGDKNYINFEDLGDALGKVIHNLSVQNKRDFMSGFNHELFHIELKELSKD